MKQNGQLPQPPKGKAVKSTVVNEKPDANRRKALQLKRRPRLPVFGGKPSHSEGE
jgi:hypothetical protein